MFAFRFWLKILKIVKFYLTSNSRIRKKNCLKIHFYVTTVVGTEKKNFFQQESFFEKLHLRRSRQKKKKKVPIVFDMKNAWNNKDHKKTFLNHSNFIYSQSGGGYTWCLSKCGFHCFASNRDIKDIRRTGGQQWRTKYFYARKRSSSGPTSYPREKEKLFLVCFVFSLSLEST